MNRIYDRKFLLDGEGKELFMKIVRAYEDVFGIEILTFCVMDNHFHLLLRVPHRPEGFDVPLETVVARLDRALGVESAALMHKQLEFWKTTGNDAATEEWRRRQVERMFSLSEFMKAVQLRFSRWFNRRAGRKGSLWEGRYTSVIVEDEERALRTMAAYIDLNPVRAGIVSDPADYRWSGYAEAMAGKARARRGLVRIIGPSAWPRGTAAESYAAGFANPWNTGTALFSPAVERRALVIYRAILGGQGAERRREDGTVVRRGVSEKVRERLTTPKERQLTAEILTRRVQHFTKGVLFGGRSFIDEWFGAHRDRFRGVSRDSRERGAKSLGRPALRGLYALRSPRP